MLNFIPQRQDFMSATVQDVWRRSNRRRTFLYPLLSFLVFLIYYFSNTPHSKPLLQNVQVSPTQQQVLHSDQPREMSMLHLLVPASSSNPNLCRTLLSAALLNYPTPIIVNWGKEAESVYNLHLAKIEGILEYLRGLPPRNDRDLVLIVDGYDVWFQLRPEVLIKRYIAINQERNDLLMRVHGSDVIANHDFRQTVVFGADKKCWPQGLEHPACYAVPDSTLSKLAFGKLTDHDPNFDAIRPRWLNSGTILGPVADVRAIFEAAARRVKERFNGERDQWYFAELFGEQEYHRGMHQDSTRSEIQTPQPTEMSTPRLTTNFTASQQIEFHIGLDYEAQLFHTNTHAAADVDWLTFNSPHSLKRLFKSHQIPNPPGGNIRSVLPQDIIDSRPPIAQDLLKDLAHEDLRDEPEEREELPFNTTWEDIPLLVNIPSKSVPVLIHINGNKTLLDPWWQKTWWTEKGWGRHLLQSMSRAPKGPLVQTADERGKRRTWWKGTYNSMRRDNGGMWTARGEWLPWGHVCGAFDDILFEGVEAGTPVDPNIAIMEQEAKLEQERLKQEQAEKERLEKERLEQDRLEREKAEQKKAEEEEAALMATINKIVSEKLTEMEQEKTSAQSMQIDKGDFEAMISDGRIANVDGGNSEDEMMKNAHEIWNYVDDNGVRWRVVDGVAFEHGTEVDDSANADAVDESG